MSSHGNEKSSHEIEQLHARAQNLRHLLKHQLDKARCKHRNFLIAGGLLVLGSIAALGNLTRLTFALDTQTLAEIGRAKVESSLPNGRRDVQNYLEAEAPRIAEAILNGIKTSLTGLSPVALNRLSESMQNLASEIESRLTIEMQQTLQTSKAQVDAELPDASESEKVVRLVTIVADRFDDNAAGAYLALYPDYSAEMEGIFRYLEDLRTKAPAQLTRKEAIQKEIIQTLLRLALHAHQSQGDGGYDL